MFKVMAYTPTTTFVEDNHHLLTEILFQAGFDCPDDFDFDQVENTLSFYSKPAFKLVKLSAKAKGIELVMVSDFDCFETTIMARYHMDVCTQFLSFLTKEDKKAGFNQLVLNFNCFIHDYNYNHNSRLGELK